MPTKEKTFTPKIIIQLLIVVIITPLLPILISQKWDWTEAWIYAGIQILGFIISRALAAKAHPDILQERAKSLERENTKSWDKILAPLVGLSGVFISIIAGLDMRYAWSGIYLSSGWKIFAITLILLGYALGSWAMISNRFFSGVVRIQEDRGHHVVDTGPYAWVRHPGYVGIFIVNLAVPILLDSLWTFGVVALFSVIIILRTVLEDRTLQEELPGYAEYAQRTRYKLFPRVW